MHFRIFVLQKNKYYVIASKFEFFILILSGTMDPMILMQNASLRRERDGLRKQVEALTKQVDTLHSLLNICDITKIFNELAPRSIYRGFFTGTYREIVLQELIARYNFTEVQGPTDRSVVIRILNRMGKDASTDGLVTIYGDRIKTSGG